MTHPDLDARPILDALEQRGGIRPLLANVGLTTLDLEGARFKRAIYRMRQTGQVSPWQADRFCIRLLGTLPQFVYGQAWWDSIPDEDEPKGVDMTDTPCRKWIDEGGTDLWFASDPGLQKAAKQLCSRCDLREACRDLGMVDPEAPGIWAGLDRTERRKLAYRRVA